MIAVINYIDNFLDGEAGFARDGDSTVAATRAVHRSANTREGTAFVRTTGQRKDVAGACRRDSMQRDVFFNLRRQSHVQVRRRGWEIGEGTVRDRAGVAAVCDLYRRGGLAVERAERQRARSVQVQILSGVSINEQFTGRERNHYRYPMCISGD